MSPPVVHSFPASHLLQLVALCRRWEVTAEELLAGSGLSEAQIETPHVRISAETLRAVSERARELTGEPGIGFYLGLHKRLSMYGYMGFATMSAATMREGLTLAIRYLPTVTTGLGLELELEGRDASLAVHEHVDMGSARDIGLFSLLVGLRQLATTMTGSELGRFVTEIPLAKPDYFDRFAHLLPDASFEAPLARVRFSARALDAPLIAPDRAALRLASEVCERQLQELGFERGLPARVLRLAVTPERVCGMDEVAQALRLSTRTLKRKLAAEGVTFSDLVDGARRERSLQLLRSELTLEEIAHRLDYSSLPNFARAFRRWTGETPARYRKRQRAAARGA